MSPPKIANSMVVDASTNTYILDHTIQSENAMTRERENTF